MKKIILNLLFLFIFVSVSSQKIYVWCPDEQNIKPRFAFLENEQVNLALFDSRIIPKKHKIECESENVLNSIQENIKKAYPNAQINILEESDFHKKSADSIVTIKINVSAYHAGFGKDVDVAIGSIGGDFSYAVIPKGKWNGLTRLNISVYDNRKESKDKYDAEIMEIESKPNLLGYKSAKDCLKVTYSIVIQRTLSFIDNKLME
jgi:hypothetical protein